MKKFFLMFMAALLFTTSSFAQVFSDLPQGHWAKGVVEEMVEAGIISGYTDGTFRPSKDISKIESLILISRIAGMKNYPNEAKQYLENYTSTLSKYNTQYKQDVAYLMGVGVLNESDLPNLLSSDKINAPLTREEMAVLVTKVMGKEAEVKKNSIVVLPFADTSSISASAKPYVYYVYSEEIMKGVDNENFSPKTSLTRAQAASVLQRIYKKVNLKPSISGTTSTPSATTFVTGTITKIDTSASSVWIKSNGITEEYEYDSKTKFYVDSKELSSSAMKVNATVTATLTDDAYITSMNISEGAKIVTTTVKGTIYAASSTNKTISVTTNGSRTAYYYDNSTTYTLNGKTSTLIDSIKKDYEITLTVDQAKYIISAKVVSPAGSKDEDDDERIIGEIIEASTKYGYIVIEDDDGDEYILMDDVINKYNGHYEDEDEDYYFDDDTDFKYNGTSKSYDAIDSTSYLYKKGSYVAITLGKNDYIDLVEIATKKSTLEKDDDTNSSTSSDEIIGEITKASTKYGYIVIETSKGKEYILMDDVINKYDGNYEDEDEDYYFNKDTKFYYEGASKTYSKIATSSYLYDEGSFVRIVLGKNQFINELEVAYEEDDLSSSKKDDDETLSSEKMLKDNYLVGKVTALSDDEITIKTDDGEKYTMDVLSDAVFLEFDKDDPADDYIDYEDAYDDEDIYVGDRVMIVLCDDEETALIILLD